MSLFRELNVHLDRRRLNTIARQNNMTPKDILFLVSDILQETFQLVKEDIRKWILRFVPKRTGQLRFTLLKALEKSKIRRGILRFIIGTQVEYATKVNQMSTQRVRHHGTHFEHSGARAYAYYYTHRSTRKTRKASKKARKRGRYVSPHRIFLNDPQAIGGFWDKLLSYFKDRILFHINNAMRKQYGKTELPWVVS